MTAHIQQDPDPDRTARPPSGDACRSQEVALTQFNYDDLDPAAAAAARDAACAIRNGRATIAAEIVAIGRRLIEVKSLIPPGQFGRWLHTECGFSDRSARNYMAVARLVARHFGGETATITDFDISTLFLLARPDVSVEAIGEVKHAVERGEVLSNEQVADVIERTQEMETADNEERPGETVETEPPVAAAETETAPGTAKLTEPPAAPAWRGHGLRAESEADEAVAKSAEASVGIEPAQDEAEMAAAEPGETIEEAEEPAEIDAKMAECELRNRFDAWLSAQPEDAGSRVEVINGYLADYLDGKLAWEALIESGRLFGVVAPLTLFTWLRELPGLIDEATDDDLYYMADALDGLRRGAELILAWLGWHDDEEYAEAMAQVRNRRGKP